MSYSLATLIVLDPLFWSSSTSPRSQFNLKLLVFDTATWTTRIIKSFVFDTLIFKFGWVPPSFRVSKLFVSFLIYIMSYSTLVGLDPLFWSSSSNVTSPRPQFNLKLLVSDTATLTWTTQIIKSFVFDTVIFKFVRVPLPHLPSVPPSL